MKTYLGDAVYADIEHDDLVLTTEDGTGITNCIVLEPEVLSALLSHVHYLRQRWCDKETL